MAPLPKRRHSTRRGGKREAAWMRAFQLPSFIRCPNCSILRLPHRGCKACGWYDGKVVVTQKVKTKKKPK
ncbi:50S ribosomal protein L32 [Candidatus Gottesmanbacteria bacterium]|nr:50S ribosomal protein L32 [Candidatus Gottesmanbacteria bacterium]